MKSISVSMSHSSVSCISSDGTHTQLNGLPVLSPEELANKGALDPVTINYLPPRNIRREHSLVFIFCPMRIWLAAPRSHFALGDGHECPTRLAKDYLHKKVFP